MTTVTHIGVRHKYLKHFLENVMKLKELCEARGELVTVSFEWENPKSEDYKAYMIEVTCRVNTQRDPFGTGDSPTEHEVDLVKAVFKDTGKPFNLNLLSDKEANHIEDKAVAALNR
jgi:hypothetical protein